MAPPAVADLRHDLGGGRVPGRRPPGGGPPRSGFRISELGTHPRRGLQLSGGRRTLPVLLDRRAGAVRQDGALLQLRRSCLFTSSASSDASSNY
jgi:hypothetical protein